MLPLTDGLLKDDELQQCFPLAFALLFLVLLTFRAAAADTLLILGDSLRRRVSNVCQRGLACLVE